MSVFDIHALASVLPICTFVSLNTRTVALVAEQRTVE